MRSHYSFTFGRISKADPVVSFDYTLTETFQLSDDLYTGDVRYFQQLAVIPTGGGRCPAKGTEGVLLTEETTAVQRRVE